MKKSVLKKVAGVIACCAISLSAIFGFAGCDKTDSMKDKRVKGSKVLELENYYIIIETPEGYCLHKGDVSQMIYGLYENTPNNNSFYKNSVIDLDCGEEIFTHNYFAMEKAPKQKFYEKVCPDCFPQFEGGLEKQ